MRVIEKVHKQVVHWGRFVWLAALFSAMLAACTNGGSIGPRPAQDLITVVEAYLQKYQPGPLPRLFQTTYLYDRNGTLIAEYFPEGRRTWAPIARISPHLLHATIAAEDSSFYANPGVDPRRIVAAVVRNIESGEVTSGASTITMQLARNLFLGAEDRYNTSIDRKLLEAGVAQELTDLFSKDEILEMYLNLLNYGSLAYGPEAAAQVYFGKSAADLTLAEASLLAGLPQQPANLNPFVNFDAARARQDVVLQLMVRHGYLSEAEAEAVRGEQETLRAYFAVASVNAGQRAEIRAPHFAQYVIDTLDEQLGAGYTARSGLRIFTTLDLDMQELAQRTVTEKVAELSPRYGFNNSALVAMKPGTAEILAMVGSADFANDQIAGQVNVAVRPRQPGSSIKPIFYAAALDANVISPATVIWDLYARYVIDKRQVYIPRNYDEKYHGPVTVRSALANSYNVPMVKLFYAAGPEQMASRAYAMGIRTFTSDKVWYGLGLSLGAGEVTLLDLTNAYTTLASEGRHNPPRAVLTVLDGRGESIELVHNSDPDPVISPQAAFLVTNILSDNEARAPMFGLNSRLHLSFPAAAKTGTTTGNRDSWTAGYSRYLAAAVWSGNTDGKPTRNSTGIGGAAPIWNAFMEAVAADPAMRNKLDAPADPAAWEFIPPPGIEEVPVTCPEGLVCRPGGEYFSDVWLQKMSEFGPMSDSTATGAITNVFVQWQDGGRQFVGYCVSSELTGQTRTLLKTPIGVGLLPAPVLLDTKPADERTVDEQFMFTEQRKLLEQERDQAIGWGSSRNTPITLGRCEQMDSIARELYGDRVAAVTVDRGSAPIAQAQPTPTAQATPEEDAQPTERAPVLYSIHSSYSDNACAGSYILGRVINGNGGPTPGVRIMAVDQWGNRAEVVSKSSEADLGNFDFPIYSGTPHEIYLNVVDGSGNPISPTVVVRHKLDNESNTCHHVVFQSVG